MLYILMRKYVECQGVAAVTGCLNMALDVKSPMLSTEPDNLYPHPLQETGKLGGGFKLRYRIEFLERRSEGVREAP